MIDTVATVVMLALLGFMLLMMAREGRRDPLAGHDLAIGLFLLGVAALMLFGMAARMVDGR